MGGNTRRDCYICMYPPALAAYPLTPSPHTLDVDWVRCVFASAELHPSQPVAAQPIRENPERRHRQVVVVANQPQRQPDNRQVSAAGGVHGDAKIREKTRPRKESGRSHKERSAARQYAQS